MNKSVFYSVIAEIGTFADEPAFKKKYMSIINDDKKRYKEVLAIENIVEPGMPDLLIIDNKDKAVFVEIKYARKGVITFERTQIPWYRRHRNLNIIVIAYNDKTRNIHRIDAAVILMKAQGIKYTLEHEVQFKLEGLL